MRSDSDIFGDDAWGERDGSFKKKRYNGSGDEIDDDGNPIDPTTAEAPAAAAPEPGAPYAAPGPDPAPVYEAPQVYEHPYQKPSYNGTGDEIDPTTFEPIYEAPEPVYQPPVAAAPQQPALENPELNNPATEILAPGVDPWLETNAPGVPAGPSRGGTPNDAVDAIDTDGYPTPGVMTAPTVGAPPGWDQGKWVNAMHQTPKYVVGRIVAQAVASGAVNLTPQLLAQIAQAYPGTTQVNRTTVNIPGVGEIQVINDGQARWDSADSFDAGGGAPGIVPGPAPTTGLVPTTAPGGAPAPTATAPGAMTSDAVNAASDALENRTTNQPTAPKYSAVNDALARLLAGALGGDVAARIGSDPAVAAFKRTNAKDFDRRRAQAVESAIPGGVFASGGLDGRLRGLEDTEAEQLSNFTGRRVVEATAEKRAEITTALQFIQNADQFLSSFNLSRDRLTQEQQQFLMNLSEHRDEFLQSLGLSYSQLSGQQQLQLRQLQQQSDQFNKNLGFNYDQFEADQNYRALMAALQGGG